MRWQHLALDAEPAPAGTPAPLFAQGAVVRRFDTPHFRGITFYEVRARSIINKVPEASRVPFRWTINPYRGCSHACSYCFARKTHTYLDLDAGRDFDTNIVVKVNAEELLRKELARPRWAGEHIAMGTNVDCYQRAEGRYELMRGILSALRDAANPFSILTKGALILRDLDLLQESAERADVSTNVSVGFVDREMWRSVESGTPSPQRRLEVCHQLNAAGIPCGVLMAPILPYLTDSPHQLESAVKSIAESGATHVSPIVLHLRPGAREWFFEWLAANHPTLVPRYEELYRKGAYAPRDFQQRITAKVHELARKHRIGATTPARTRRIAAPAAASQEQLSLL
ncbi:MAG: Rv2578c family radical SAM protein [Actinomycetes bacterium]